jgi:hypothetical protein
VSDVADSGRCIIERTEVGERTRCDDLVAANDWLDSLLRWEGRIVATKMLNSRLRCEGLVQWRGSFALDSFAWLVPPVLNPCTRIAVEMCPARSLLRAVGYELAAGRDVPDPVTLSCGKSFEEIAISGH